MKKIKTVFFYIFTLLGLYLGMSHTKEVKAAALEKEELLESYELCLDNSQIKQEESEISVYGLRTNDITIQSNARVSYFDSSDYGEGHKPRITTSIKYIVEDGSNGDSRDQNGNFRRRYVYCLSHEKDAPIGQTLYKSSWTSSEVYYVIHHGALYYGELSRTAAYSTGNWQWDYLATHFAIVVVSGQYTLDQVKVSIQRGNAAAADKNKLIIAVSNMVNDARSQKGKAEFDSEGWFRLDSSYGATFTLKQNSTGFYYENGNYYSDWISPFFKTKSGYYANDEITSLNCSTSDSVSIEKKFSDCTHSPYRLVIDENRYKEWQRTGKTITTYVTIQVPSCWKMARFVSPINSSHYQDVALAVYSDEKGYANYQAQVSFSIPRAYIDLQVKKLYVNQDEMINESQVLKGAEFTVFSDESCENPVNKGVTDENGVLTFSDLSWGTVYYLKETASPPGYALPEPNTIYKINTATTDRVINYTVYNHTGILLPETGSFGVLGMVLSGAFIMSFVFFDIKKRRRKDEFMY